MDNLQRGEKVLYEGKPENRTLLMWIISKSLFFTIYYFFCIGWIPILLWFILRKGPIFELFLYIDIAVFVAILIITIVYQFPLFMSHKYIITNQNVIVKAGVISKRERIIPFDKITDVTVSQNLFEQIFGLFRLWVQTAGMGNYKTAVSFLGLGNADIPKNLISGLVKRNKN